MLINPHQTHRFEMKQKISIIFSSRNIAAYFKIMLNIYFASIHSRSCMLTLFRWMLNGKCKHWTYLISFVHRVECEYNVHMCSNLEMILFNQEENEFSIKSFSFQKKINIKWEWSLLLNWLLWTEDEHILLEFLKWIRNATTNNKHSLLLQYLHIQFVN